MRNTKPKNRPKGKYSCFKNIGGHMMRVRVNFSPECATAKDYESIDWSKAERANKSDR